MMRVVLAAGVAVAALSSSANGQSMPGMDMSGHAAHQHDPAVAPARKSAKRKAAPAPAPRSAPARKSAADGADHGSMDHSVMPEVEHGAMPDHESGTGGMPATAAPGASPHDHGTHDMLMDGDPAVGTALPAGNAPAPAPPRDHYGDRAYGAKAMAASRKALAADHGGMTFSQILFNIAEYQARRHGDGFRWDGEAWFGGDINRLTIKSEGEGGFGDDLDHAEAQALYSRAIDPYWNLQAGIRHDFRPRPGRTYATIGVEGLAPYWFEVEAALFLSDHGDLLGRLEAWHDMRLTQRLVLQPRAELNLAAQDMPAERIGAGLSDAELGLRLRYEIRREFAPYVGVSWSRKVGDTARFARRAGEDARATSLVIGLRAWF